MSEILEATMLVCFGFSWPINLIKNIRARSAKGMSLQFILLIIVGYVAGLTSKIISHRINYVLIVYFFNLAIVSCNLVVYFHNRVLDRRAKKAADDMALHAEQDLQHMQTLYAEMNSCLPENAVVFFGSNHFSELAVAELAHSYHLDATLCNRSVANVTIDKMAAMLDVCVLDLKPRSVFLNLGDADLESAEFDAAAFLSHYDKLITTIQQQTGAKIYVVSLLSDAAQAKTLDERLEALSRQHGCGFIDISGAVNSEQPDLRTFAILEDYFLRKAAAAQ